MNKKLFRAGLAVALLALLPTLNMAHADADHEAREQYVQLVRKVSQLSRDALKLMQDGDYGAALGKLEKAHELMPRNANISYNLACAQARSGQTDKALASLKGAVQAGFTDHEHIRSDADLESLRQSPEFEKIVELAKEKSQPKPPLLSMPKEYEKDGKQSYPLFVALHGAGGSAKQTMPWIKGMLPAADYFILVPFGSAKAGPGYTWTSKDPELLAKQIAELRKQYRISRVYLFGYSAGGHLGYSMVLTHRDTVDAFIPLAGGLRSRSTPEDALKKAAGLPVFAIQGTSDRVVPIKAAQRSLNIFKKHGAVVKMHEYAGSHRPPRDLGDILKQALAWIDAALDKRAAENGGQS